MANYLKLRIALLAIVMAFIGSYSMKAAEPTIKLSGRIVESLAHRDLMGARVYLTDSLGVVIDSVICNSSAVYGDANGNWFKRAYFDFNVPRKKATYNFEVLMDDYAPYYTSYTVDNIGRREIQRKLPDFVLHRAPKKELGEVTVTASKVKFYNKGDTLVFNADAFELAEGSMLDALIKQLPGVEIREGGKIYVNGEFVENLLLNGKDFFKGNNEIMLDNLPSYTVKDVQVYRRADEMDKWAGRNGQKELVMDVKLKKEYNTGWIMNFEAGIGTSERYMGRVFISRFTNQSRVSLIGNINNLNDNRKPGEKSTWTPEKNTTGTLRTKLVGIDYQASNPNTKFDINGNFLVRHNSQDDITGTDHVNFLADGSRPAEYRYSDTRFRDLALSTGHNVTFKGGKTFNRVKLDASYNKSTSNMASIGGAFKAEQNEMSRALLDSIYSGGATLEDLINRTRTVSRNTGHSANGSLDWSGSIKIPKSNDSFMYGADLSMSDSKMEVWRDYTINYGADPKPAIHDNQYYDNSPNRKINFGGYGSYNYNIDDITSLQLTYQYQHGDEHKDSYMYALDRLTDMGIIGSLPEGYLAAYDAEGSYRSHLVENSHRVTLNFSRFSGYKKFEFVIRPTLRFVDRNFDYYRGDRNHHVDQKHTLFLIPDYSAQVWLRLSNIKINGRPNFRHRFNLRLLSTPTLPDPVKMVDVIDSNDPMNIWVGNSSLKPSYKLEAKLIWTFATPVCGKVFRSNVDASYSYTIDDLVNGYLFNEQTGVRTNRTYNLHSGNYTAKFHVYPYMQFGSKNQFSVNYFGGVDYLHYADLAGGYEESPLRTSVYTWWQVHKAGFSWQIGNQRIGINGEYNGRYTASSQADFRTINAVHTTVSVYGNFTLPKGFGISTDFNIYSRHGYGNGLDKTDPVWNARLSYAPKKIPMVFMLDGFDILHRLSNVQYAQDARGRTITYTNVLPRYFMFHVQYKLNILPKKKVPDTRYTF